MNVKNEKKVLLLKLNTWISSSNGIYNYKAASIKNDKTYFDKTTYLVRTKDNILEKKEQQGNINFKEEDLIFYIKNEIPDEFTLINFMKKNLELNENNYEYINNKIWYVLKTSNLDNQEDNINCNEEYYLKENDLIKLGKVKYAVQKIHILKKDDAIHEDEAAMPIIENMYNISELNKNTNPVFEFVYQVKNFKGYFDNNEKDVNLLKEDVNKYKCKYCYLMNKNKETDDGEDFLISVCKCNKCNKLVHYKCLKNNIQLLKEIVDEKQFRIDESLVFKNFECEDCHTQFPLRFKLKGINKTFNLIDIKEPNDYNYMILESIDYTYNERFYKFIHIIKFIKESGEPITLGREKENDIVERDITISRKHAIFRFNKETGKISIQNWESSFGTLILIKNPIKVLDKTIYLQVGRTYIEACLTDIEEYNKVKKEQMQLGDKINEKNDNE